MRNLFYLATFFFTGIILLRMYQERKDQENKDDKDHQDDEKSE